jgi:uncharacterized membrane protein
MRRAACLRLDALYLAVALGFGVTLALLIPPFQNFDEVAHYQRAWSVARGDLLPRADATVRLPRSAAELPERFEYVEVAEGRQRHSPARVRESLGEPISTESVGVVCFAAGYNALAYLPQALGIGIVWLAGGSPLAALFAARVANLLACLGLTAVALRWLPFGRPLLFLVALFPMVVVQMASASADGLTLAGSFLFGALCLESAQRGRLARGRALALVAAAAVLLNFKPGYAPLSLLLLLLRPEQLGSRARYAAYVAAGTGLSLLAMAAVVGSGPDPRTVLRPLLGPSHGVDPAAQLRLLLAEPAALLRVMAATFAGEALDHAKHMVGSFAWGNLEPTDTPAVALAIGLILCLQRDEPPRLSGAQRLVLLGSSLATAFVVALGAYLAWTPVGAESIQLIQGRYFLPALPGVLFACQGLRLGARASIVAALASVGVAILATLRTLARYYF